MSTKVILLGVFVVMLGLCLLRVFSYLTTSDLILSFTALILLWYTNETHLQRVQTSQQNDLMAKQLEIMRDSFILDQAKLRSSLEPILSYDGGMSGAIETIHVVNRGTTMRDVTIVGDENVSNARMDPYNFVGPSDRVKILLTWGTLPGEGICNFIVEYSNILGGRGSKHYRFNRNLDPSARLVERPTTG